MEKVDEKERFFLKDELFNKKKVEYLAELVESAYPDFDNKKFVSLVVDEFSKLELKERIFWILEKLEEALPSDFEKAVKIILKALPPELDNEKVDNDFGDFIFSPFEYFVSKNGCEKKNLKTSFFALSEITKRFTVEGGVRFFINKYPEETFDFMKKMARSKNYHQRRLASEGLRPKLPWCIGIEFDYKKSFEILDLLCFDKTRYVLRSVANHLNDVSKINPDFVVEVLEGWKKKLEDQKTSSLEGGEFQYLVWHGLRTSIRKGHEKTLEFLGFSTDPQIKFINFFIKKEGIKLGEYLEFSFEIFSEKKENLIIDYKVVYPSKSSRKSEKVFKIKKVILEKDHKIKIDKKHLFKKMTTKKLYSGEYFIEVQVNGKVFEKKNFFLEV